jgi:uncharacterized protein
LHLVRNGYRVFVGINGNKEIDFMAEKDDERLYIQVAYMLTDNQTIQREFGNLLAIDDNYSKYVVTMDELAAGNAYKGIKQIHLRDFLINYK